METQKNNGMCRCCASEGTFKDVKSSYQWMGEEEVYAEMLRESLDISLCADVTGEVEGGICEVCITQLRNASNFKKQVLHTEEQFKQRLQDKFFKNEIVKVELAPEHEEESDNDNDNNVSLEDDYSGTEFEVPVKTESLEESKPKKRTKALKASTSRATRAKKLKKEDGESSKRKTGRKILKKVTKTALRKARSAAMKTVRVHKNNLIHILMHSNANPIRCKDMLEGIQCHYCKATLYKSEDLKVHFVLEHRDEPFILSKMKEFAKIVWKLDITDLRCDVCGSSMQNIKDLLIHFKDQHDMEVEPDVEDIYLPFKFDTQELRCAICNVEFAVFKLLREHMNAHFRNFVCDECDAGYVNHELLYRHKLRHRVSVTSCPICNKVYSSKQRADQHMKTVHLNSKRYKCPDCGERFQEFNMKLRHMQKAHGKNMALSCQICDRIFVAPRALRMHVRQFHMGEKRFLCAECGKGFLTRKLLKDHQTMAHSVLESSVCEICLAIFLDKSDLLDHIKTHYLVQCVFCAKSFVNNSTLKTHVQTIHSNLFEV